MTTKNYVQNLLKQFKNLPRFDDERIDFTSSNTAPVMTCFVSYKDEFLLLKRSHKVGSYQGYWFAVGGYVDEIVSIEEKARTEVNEELGVQEKNIEKVTCAEPFMVNDKTIPKTWIVHPVLLTLKEKVSITLDWEHDEYKWVQESQFKDFKKAKGFDESFEKIKPFLR